MSQEAYNRLMAHNTASIWILSKIAPTIFPVVDISLVETEFLEQISEKLYAAQREIDMELSKREPEEPDMWPPYDC